MACLDVRHAANNQTNMQLRRLMIPVLPGTFSQWHCDCGITTNNNNQAAMKIEI